MKFYPSREKQNYTKDYKLKPDEVIFQKEPRITN